MKRAKRLALDPPEAEKGKDKKITQALRLLDEARVLSVNYDGEEDTYTVIRLNVFDEEIHEVFPGALLEV
jgi:hypothetical protein